MTKSSREGRTRRELLRDAGALAASATVLGAMPAHARRRMRPQTVAVIGGGIAGLTAAHELAERGFAVTVYERARILGGKARSFGVPGTAAGGRLPLPGEHSLRFVPGWYHHLTDTMRRIPATDGRTSCYESLAESAFVYARSGGRTDAYLPLIFGFPITAQSLVPELVALLEHAVNLPADEIAEFAVRVTVFLTSSEERRVVNGKTSPGSTSSMPEGNPRITRSSSARHSGCSPPRS